VQGFLSPLQKIRQRFFVSEAQIAAHLAEIRQQLPTTEVILIGKPQAGKSSIVRGMTGQSADMVGQGFRPHTRHTQRYPYPAADLPLLVFTDTVGLGDVDRNLDAIVAELQETLAQDPQRSRIFILTIKVTDFATDSLHQVITQLKQAYPSIPCLLAVTCLHELYGSPTDNHPPYPPELAGITRAVEAMQGTFGALCDRTLLLDFTLEEDGYDPVFYGLEALQAALDALLPQAEAQAIHQLLRSDARGQAIGDLYRQVARHYISAFAVMAGIVAAVPLPFATMPVLTSLQVSMVVALGQVYNQRLSASQALGVVTSLAGGFFAQAVGREVIKFIPGLGSVLATSWSVGYTWALGEGACVYFGDLMAGKVPDPKAIQTLMRQTFRQAKQDPPTQP
jgi:uncharacterized protein (DUF697 family)